jgi:hypothetical protein
MPIISGLESRSDEIKQAAKNFELDKVMDPDARQIRMAVARLAAEMIQRITGDDDELIAGLHELYDAGQTFVRAKTGVRR